MKRTLLLAVLLLAGCGPNAVTYYRPEMAGAAVLRGGCGVQISDAIRIDASGTEILLQYLDAAGQRRAGLYAQIRVPAHQRFAFEGADFALREEPGGRPLPVHGIDVRRNDTQRTLTAPYEAGDVELSDPGRANKRWYYVTVYTDNLALAEFSLRLPAVIVNGVKTDLPAVRFRRTTSVGMSPLNC